MKSTDILKSEHRVIEQVLNCLEQVVERCRAARRLDAQSAREAIDFFRSFADGCHHGKEETHLFPALEAKGFSRDSGPTGVMIQEHELGRAHIREMAAAVDRAAAGEPAAVEEFCAQASGYVALLRQHIDKEDHCLFAMADEKLSHTDQQQLLAAFQVVESEHMGVETHERYLRLADGLAERLGVAKASSGTSAGPACGCTH